MGRDSDIDAGMSSQKVQGDYNFLRGVVDIDADTEGQGKSDGKFSYRLGSVQKY